MPVQVTEDNTLFPENHFLCWAVMDKQIFVPSLFAFGDQQPLRFLTSCQEYAQKTPAGWTFAREKVRECYQYLWIYNPRKEVVSIPKSYELLHDVA